jgi:hypothetical protein
MFSPKVNLPSTNVPGKGSNALYCAAKAPVRARIVLNHQQSTSLLGYHLHCNVILNHQNHERFRDQ